jgi:hypothetical protein
MTVSLLKIAQAAWSRLARAVVGASKVPRQTRKAVMFCVPMLEKVEKMWQNPFRKERLAIAR